MFSQHRYLEYVLILILILSSMKHVNSYGCDCSCCTGSGCTPTYLGTIQVSTCSGRTCTDACVGKYSTCASGSSSVLCSATNIFHFYSLIFLIISTILLVLFIKH